MQVDREVDQDEGEAVDQHDALHQRIVARQNALHDETADARQREHLLDHHRAADRRRQQDADRGDDEDQRVAKRVLGDGLPFAEALGARGPDVVLAEHVEHRRARHAREKADLEQRQHRGGQNQRTQPEHGILHERACSRRSETSAA